MANKLQISPIVQTINYIKTKPLTTDVRGIQASIISTSGTFQGFIGTIDFEDYIGPAWLVTNGFPAGTDEFSTLPLELQNLENLPVGDYKAMITINADFTEEYIQRVAIVNLTVTDPIDEPTDPENPGSDQFKLKYWIENTNFNSDDVYRTEISQKGYNGNPIEIQGRVSHKYQDKKDVYEPIISSSLQLELEARLDLTMSDLYSEEENTHRVVLTRNSQVIFIGFIKPDGIYESLVEDYWILDVDAFDGLSTLKNLSFVRADGTHLTGKRTMLEIIKTCLERTTLNLPINVYIPLSYEGYTGSSILKDTLVSTERYYQTGSKEIMNSEEVLKSILRLFNASIIQQDGEWYIFRTIDLKENVIFSRFVDGEFSNFKNYNPVKQIGSHINTGSGLIHCGANQKKSISASVQAYRLYYKHGLVANLTRNPYIEATKSGQVITSDGWSVRNIQGTAYDTGNQYNINDSIGVQDDGTGLILNTNSSFTHVIYNGELIVLNQTVFVGVGTTVKVEVGFVLRTPDIGSPYMTFYMSTDNYFLNDGNWVPKSGNSQTWAARRWVKNWNGDFEADYEIPPAPESSNITFGISFDNVPILRTGKYNFASQLNYINIIPAETNAKGFYYTGERNTRVSSVIKENQTVYNGTGDSAVYVGNINKLNGEPTGLWHYNDDISSLSDLLQLNVQDNLRVAPRPMQVYEGDTLGYFPYLSMLSFDLLQGDFIPTEYEFKVVEDKVKLSAREIETDKIPLSSLKNGTILIETDYGNETKVLIRS